MGKFFTEIPLTEKGRYNFRRSFVWKRLFETPSECMLVFMTSVLWCCLTVNRIGRSRRILVKITNIKIPEIAFSIYQNWYIKTDRRKWINELKVVFLVVFFPKLPQTVTQSMYIAADCWSQRDRVSVMFSVLLHSIFTVQTVQSTAELYLQ